jgi:uncharacterized protein YtpQ (UPF0354 family)
MSELKDFLGDMVNKKNNPPTGLDAQLPEKKVSTIYPYLKYSGGDDDIKPGYTFTIEEDDPIIATATVEAANTTAPLEMQMVCKKILPDCMLYYGFDLGKMFIQVMPTDFNAALRLDNLHLIAKENLGYFVEHVKPPEIQSYEGGINMITCGGDYEASFILFGDMLQDLQDQLGGPLWICIPARDMFIFTTKDNNDGIALIRKMVTEQYANYHRNMSKYLYELDGKTWTVVEKMVD